MKNKHYIFGQELEGAEISIEDANKYFFDEYLLEKSTEFLRTPIDSILGVIDRAGKIFISNEKPYYDACMEELPSLLGYAPKMVEKAMSFIPGLLARETMLSRLSHLGDHHLLDYNVYKGSGRLLRAIPLGVVTHIAAGNTFLGAIDSLLYGLITKNINIVKMASADRFFPIVFMEALREADTQGIVFPYVAMTYWKHDNMEVQNLVKKNSDAILLFGGEESVAAFKKEVAPRCEVLTFGPKVSFGIVTRGQSEEELSAAAQGFAQDIVFWEQRACTACQNIFIERSDSAEFFIGKLMEELELAGEEYPQEPVGSDAAVEIRKQRELAIWEEFNQQGRVLEGKSSNHTIIIKNSIDLTDSPLERTVIVNFIDDWREIPNGSAKLLKYYMSTISIASQDVESIIEKFLPLGVMRFCSPGLMSSSAGADNSHDGRYIVESLIKFINFENFNDQKLGLDFADSANRDAIMLSRLNVVLEKALKTRFYSERFAGLSLPLNSIDQFKQLRPLEKSEMAEISAHHSDAAFSDEAKGCYIFSAGGTTGLKKYVLYSNDEFSKSKEIFGKGFRALGIGPDNVVANIFPAGAMYTAFLAINKGLEESGCRILSITGNIPNRDILEYFITFRPDTIFGVPAIIIPLAQYAEENNYDIQIKNVVYAAEHMTQDAKTYIKRVFKADRISSFGYAAVETGPIGFQCPHCADNEFHAEEEWAYVESDENSEAIVTCLYKTLQPVVRYKVGDLIEFVSEPCSCGRRSPKFKLKGRSGEKIRISGLCEFYFEDFEKIVRTTIDDGFVMQLCLEPDGVYTRVLLTVETKHSADSAIRANLESKLKDGIPALSMGTEKSFITEFVLSLAAPGSLERVERSGKVRRIIDHRVE